MKVAQLLGLLESCRHQVCRDTDCLHHRVMALSESLFQPLVAGNQKASLTSFSIALPIQALRGLPCLGSFSVVWRLRHIEGHPRLGSYSVDWRVSHLKGHPELGPTLYLSVSGLCWASLSIVQLLMLVCGEREAMVMAPPATHDSAVSPCFRGCLAFLHQHFPPESPPSHPLNPSHHSKQ